MSSEAGLPAGTELFLGKGHYRIAGPADEGSVGRYLAEDLDSSRPVILVSLRSSSLGPEGIARFLQQAGLLAALSAAHAGVARLSASGRDDDRVFLVVEKPRGRPLDEVLARGKRLEIDPALRIARRVAEVLEAAHRMGVTHGTLAAQAVSIDERDSKVTVGGFETAIATGCQAPTLVDPSIDGGAGLRAAERADVQALGEILYRLLAGAAPTRSGFVPVGRLRPDVPPNVDALITETLGHSSGDVPDVSRLLNDLYVTLRRPAAPPEPRRLARPVLVVGLAVLVVAAGGLVLRLRPSPPGESPPVTLSFPSPPSPVAQPAVRPGSGGATAEQEVTRPGPAPSPVASPTTERAPAQSAPVVVPGSTDAGATRESGERSPPESSKGTLASRTPAARPDRTSPAAPALGNTGPTRAGAGRPPGETSPASPAARPPARTPGTSAEATTPRGTEGGGAVASPPVRPSDPESEDPGALIDWLIRSRAGGR